jgi:thiamine pyrophosphokinase
LVYQTKGDNVMYKKDKNITLEKALEIVYKEFCSKDKIRVFGMNGDTIDILLALGGDEFLERFKNRFQRRYITNDEIDALNTVVSLFLDCDRDIAKAIGDFEHNLNFDDDNKVYFDLRKVD